MRVAHVTDFYLPRLGGIEMHVYDLASRQRAAGLDVEVITSWAEGSQGYDDGGLRVRRVPAWSSARAHRLVRGGDYDVVHAHAGVLSPLAYYTARAASMAGLPTVITAHSLLSYAEPVFRATDLALGWSNLPIVWTAVSDVAADPLRRLLGPGADDVLLLPNGIDPHVWQVDPRPRLGHDVLVVAVMRLAARKRPLPLLSMLRRAERALPDGIRMRAVIVGEGPQRPVMERYLRRHRMSSWVELAGRYSRPDIRRLFAKADFFVAPATLESFGIAALEARCAGLPVIAHAESGVASFITSEVEGLLVDNDQQMTSAITRLAAEPATRCRMAAYNRATPSPITWHGTLSDTAHAYDLAAARVGVALPSQPVRAPARVT